MITTNTVKRIIKKLLKGEDYRIEVVNLINEEFLKYAIEFFKKVAEAKLKYLLCIETTEDTEFHRVIL